MTGNARPSRTSANPLRELLAGLAIAAGAILLRLLVRMDVGGDQAIFSYPAIVIATLAFGARAGAISAAVCLVALWYFVIPVRHSFVLGNWRAGMTLGVYVVVACALVWSIAGMRAALARYRALTDELERRVLRRTAERNRVWERSRELVVVLNADDGIELANPAFAQAVGREPADGHRDRLTEFFAEEDRPALADTRARLAAGEAGVTFEGRLWRGEAAQWISWSAVAETGRLYLVGRDFTAEKECGDQLQQSQKMEAVGQMTGGMAHDFANLLSPIRLTLDMLARRHGDDARTAELIRGAIETTDRATQLIRRLMDFARPGAAIERAWSVATLLDRVAPMLHQAIGGRALRIDVADGLPSVRVDADQFDTALLNLAINARDATASDGQLTLEARTEAGGATVAITLADDGAGMDAATLARAIDPFFTTKTPGKGTGLGLPMVQGFAVRAGGRFVLSSAPGEGTRATLSLPVAR